METLIDNYKEHTLHRGNSIKYKNTCSECFKVDQTRDRKVVITNIDTSLMSERSAHPENRYW